MAGAPNNHDDASGLMHYVNAADINFAIGQLISLFLVIFDDVAVTNSQNAQSSFTFDYHGALVTDVAMRTYTTTLADASPHTDDLSAHAAWVFRVVPASLKGALARLSGHPSSLVIAVCEMYVYMAMAIMESLNDDNGDIDDVMMGDAEEGEEESDVLDEASDEEDDADGDGYAANNDVANGESESTGEDVDSDATEFWNVWMIE